MKIVAMTLLAMMALASFGSANASEAGGDQGTEADTSVTLYRHASFQIPIATLSGSGCHPLSFGADNEASSVSVTGPVILFKDGNCGQSGGQSLQTSVDIADLRQIGFDDQVSSVFIP